jgi:Uncharacterized conserved protein
LPATAVAETQHWKNFTGTRKLIGIHLTRQAMANPGGNLILAQVKKLLSVPHYRLVFFNDQRGTAGASATEQQYREFFGPDCTLVPYTTIDKLLGLLNACDLVMTSKLHVGIVAAARAKPVLAFPYHLKTQRFYKQIGRPDLCLPYTDWNPSNIESMFAKVDGLVHDAISLPVPLLERAKSNRRLIDEFLETYAA